MSNKIKVQVTGGMLIAEKNTDPDYPGISISFVPDCGGGNTELALLEESDKTLALRSYMNVPKDEPDSHFCVYDEVLLSQVSYGIYLERCRAEKEVPMNSQYFAEFLFYNPGYMECLLPENLYQKYKDIFFKERNL